MDGIGELFSVWLAIMSAQAGTQIALNPPADSAAIEQVEEHLSQSLPDDLGALYRVANGQETSWIPWKRAAHGPLFEHDYQFLPLEDALQERERRLNAGFERQEDSRAVLFPADWLPFAADGDGNGLAMDLTTDERSARGRIKMYSSVRAESTDLGPTLESYLRRRIEVADFLSLHSPSDDPLRIHLRRWYHDQTQAPSAATQDSLEDALRYWLGFRWHEAGGIAPHYPWVIAMHMDEQVACKHDVEAASEGVRLANDWLLESNMITQSRHAEVESIRLDSNGKRKSMLSQGTRSVQGRGEDCRYSYQKDTQQ